MKKLVMLVIDYDEKEEYAHPSEWDWEDMLGVVVLRVDVYEAEVTP